VASGQPWWGRPTTRVPVVNINFELHGWAMAQRLEALCAARPECQDMGDTLHLWNLRGDNTDLSLLRPQLEEQLLDGQFGLVILDPIYKVLGDRDENANGQVAGLMNELEQLARRTGAAVIVAHHFAKGDSTTKNALDRMSGAGAWVRDPDSIFVLTPHEEPDCFTVTSILRNQPVLPDFVVRWDFPLLRPALDLNPDALRTPQSKNKRCSDKEFVEKVIGPHPKSYKLIMEQAKRTFEMSPRTAARFLERLTDGCVINHSGTLYWAKNVEE
jgi:hypothetical protein